MSLYIDINDTPFERITNFYCIESLLASEFMNLIREIS